MVSKIQNGRMMDVFTGDKTIRLHPNGCLCQSKKYSTPSKQWLCTGAVRFNNFGHIVERFSLEDVFAGNIQWKYKNGKQRVHLTDIDHGAARIWMNPNHEVRPSTPK